MTWAKLQREVSDWAARNFGENPPELLMLGIIEEIAEFFDPANLSRESLCDALGDQAIYALNLCDKVGLDFAKDIANDLNQPQHFHERQMLGFLGLGCRAILKHAQGIRGMDSDARRAHLNMTVALWFRWAQGVAETYALPPMLDIVEDTWAKVQKRDWRKRPVDAHEQQTG